MRVRMSFNICKASEHVWEHKEKLKCIGVAPGEVPGLKRCKVCGLSKKYDMAKEEV